MLALFAAQIVVPPSLTLPLAGTRGAGKSAAPIDCRGVVGETRNNGSRSQITPILSRTAYHWRLVPPDSAGQWRVTSCYSILQETKVFKQMGFANEAAARLESRRHVRTAGRGPQGMAGPRRNRCQIICISHHESFRTLCDNQIQVRRHISCRPLLAVCCTIT